MRNRGHAFGAKGKFGRFSKGARDYSMFPPFTPGELNTTDPSGLGTMVMDADGRVYQKVRYVQTTTAGVPGMIVAWQGPYSTVGTEFTFAAQNDWEGASVERPGQIGITDAGSAWGSANLRAGDDIMFFGSAANAHPILRRIISHDVKSTVAANEVWCKISERRGDLLGNQDTSHDGFLDGEALTSTASQINTIPTNGTKGIVVPRMTDVVLCAVGATPVANFVLGVLLGDVTAASGALPTSTYYYTWIQVYGLGFVLAKGATTATVAGEYIIGSNANPGYGLGTAGAAITSATAPRMIGHALAATTADALVPAFINPVVKPPYL